MMLLSCIVSSSVTNFEEGQAISKCQGDVEHAIFQYIDNAVAETPTSKGNQRPPYITYERLKKISMR